MPVSNLSSAQGFSPVETAETIIPVIDPATVSSTVPSTGEGNIAPTVSSPIPGEVLPISASTMSPSAETSVAAGVGATLSAALQTVPEGPEGDAAKVTPSSPGGSSLSTKIEAQGRGVPVDIPEPPVGLVEMPAPATEPGATPKPAPTYQSVLSPIVAPKKDNSVTVPPSLQASAVTPRGNYSSVLPAMSGAKNQPARSSAPAPTSFKAVADEYRTAPQDFTITEQNITDRSTDVGSRWNFGTMEAPNALVIHHTAGRGSTDGVIQTFTDRNFPAHFVIDRDGGITQVLDLNQKGQHTRPAENGSGINNSNSWGVEIIAKDDNDLTPAQMKASIELEKFLETKGLDPSRVVGHGEINRHKQETEGHQVVSMLRSLANG